MAENLAAKYSDKVDERYKLKSLTDSAVNQDYDWAGVNTVNIYNVNTASMNNYTRSGSARYGTANDLGDTITSYTLSRDRSFTYVIDRGDWAESMYATEAGKSLARQIDEVVVPEIDTYRLSVFNHTAHTTKAHTTDNSVTTTSNAYDNFLNCQSLLNDALVPLTDRIAFMNSSYYRALKRDSSFVKNADLAYTDLKNGQIGEVDGVVIILTPSTYMPYDTDLIVVHPSMATAPLKLEDYKIHDNPPGYNGWLTEGRIIYDCFALTAKTGAVAIHSTSPSS